MPNGYKKQNNGASLRLRTRLFSPHTAEGLVTISLLVLAGASALSLAGLGGPFGRFFDQVINILFGWGEWLLPFYLLMIAAMRLQKTPRRGAIIAGLSFFAL